jgi:hypothetical protein
MEETPSAEPLYATEVGLGSITHISMKWIDSMKKVSEYQLQFIVTTSNSLLGMLMLEVIKW